MMVFSRHENRSIKNRHPSMKMNEWNFNIIYQEVSHLLIEFRWGRFIKAVFFHSSVGDEWICLGIL
jgi:hypothetical protein